MSAKDLHDHFKVACQRLSQSGMRLTQPRREILQLMIKNHGPFSADQIFDLLPQRALCDLATVYRNLQSLEELQVLRRCDFGDGIARFEFYCNEHVHHHLICKKCKKVESFEFDWSNELKSAIKQKGFLAAVMPLDLLGVCRSCS